MTREILGDILKRMANDGQSQENMGKVAAHYNAMTATIENNDDPNNEHKNTNGTWKTPEQIWGELQLGKKGGSQTTDATVEPQTVSGGSVSTSDDGSSESQEIQPDQVIEQGGYEYKFGVDADGMPVYYTKKKGGKNWTEVDPKEEDGKEIIQYTFPQLLNLEHYRDVGLTLNRNLSRFNKYTKPAAAKKYQHLYC